MPIATTMMAYVADGGVTYQRRTYTDLATALGNTAEAKGAHPRLVSQIKPRYVLGRAASGKEHKLIIGDPANSLYTGAAAGSNPTVSVPDPAARGTGGSNITLTCVAAVGEKRYDR